MGSLLNKSRVCSLYLISFLVWLKTYHHHLICMYMYVCMYVYICVCIYMYTYVPLYHVQFRFQCINSQWTNSATRSGPLHQLFTMKSDEPPSPTVTHFYSSDVRCSSRGQLQFVCCGCFLLAFSWVCWRFRQEYKKLIFVELAKVNLILLTEWPEESYQTLSASDI